jgi:hypothetical protein
MNTVQYCVGPNSEWLTGLKISSVEDSVKSVLGSVPVYPPPDLFFVAVCHDSIFVKTNAQGALCFADAEARRASLVIRLTRNVQGSAQADAIEGVSSWMVAPSVFIRHFAELHRYLQMTDFDRWKADAWLAWPGKIVAIYLYARALELAVETGDDDLRAQLLAPEAWITSLINDARGEAFLRGLGSFVVENSDLADRPSEVRASAQEVLLRARR